MKKANLAFTGIPTFCRTPHAASLDHIESQIAVLGIPFDEGVGYRPGTRFGPRSIRIYRIAFIAAVIVGAMMELEFVWNFSDLMNGMMALPNLVALLILSKVVKQETDRFFKTKP